jgi:hypothetical protein
LWVFDKGKGVVSAFLSSDYGSLDALLQAEIGMDASTSTSVVRARIQQGAKQSTGKVLSRGGDQKSEQAKSMPDSGIDSQIERARQTGVSRDTQQKLDRLARDFPALHEEVKAGTRRV